MRILSLTVFLLLLLLTHDVSCFDTAIAEDSNLPTTDTLSLETSDILTKITLIGSCKVISGASIAGTIVLEESLTGLSQRVVAAPGDPKAIDVSMVSHVLGSVLRWSMACVYGFGSGSDVTHKRGAYSSVSVTARMMTVSKYSPSTLPSSGGPVTISGQGFLFTEGSFDSSNTEFVPALGVIELNQIIASSIISATEATFTIPDLSVLTAVNSISLILQSGSLRVSVGSVAISSTSVSVTTVSPVKGGSSGGNVVTVTGSGFQSGSSLVCSFGGLDVAADVISTSQLTCVAPAPGSRTVSFNVRESSTDVFSSSYVYLAALSIVKVEPTVFPSKGASITISGRGFLQLSSIACVYSGPGFTQATIIGVVSSDLVAYCPVSLVRSGEDATETQVTLSVREGSSADLSTGSSSSLAVAPGMLGVYEAVKVKSVSPMRVDIKDTPELTLTFDAPLFVPDNATPQCVFQITSERTKLVVSGNGLTGTCTAPEANTDKAVSVRVAYTLNGGTHVGDSDASFTFVDAASGEVVVTGVSPPAIPDVFSNGGNNGGNSILLRPLGVGVTAESADTTAAFVLNKRGICRFSGTSGSVNVTVTQDGVDFVCVVPPEIASSPFAATGQLPYFSVQISTDAGATFATATYPVQVYPIPTVSRVTPTAVNSSVQLLTVIGTSFTSLKLGGETIAECVFETIGTRTEATVVNSTHATCPIPVLSPQKEVTLALSLNGDDSYEATPPLSFPGCPAGTFSPNSESECTPCSVGTFSPSVGSVACTSCALNSFGNGTGLSKCTECPENAVTAQTGSTSLSDCVCKGGYHWKDFAVLTTCVECPVNAVCDNPLEPPKPEAGFWSDSAEPRLIFSCSPAEACPGGSPLSCREGHSGLVCGECNVDHYKANGLCERCDSSAPLFLAGFILFMFVVAVIFVIKAGKNASGFFSAISIIVTYFQVLSVSGTFDLKWPDSVAKTTYYISIPFTINLDFLESECTLPWSYRGKLISTLGIPFLFAIVFFILYVMVFLRKRTVDVIGPPIERRFPGFVAAPSPPVGMGARFRFNFAMLLTKRWSHQDLQRILNFMINGFTMVLTLSYLFLVVKSMELFKCTEQTNEISTLDADPSIRCYSSHWWSMFPFAILGILVYAIGVPVAFRMLFTASISDDRNFMQRFSALFERYRKDHANWESHILIRKLGIAIAKILLSDNGIFQPIFALITLFVALQLHSANRPYNAERFNRLEATLLWCSCMTLFAGVVFQAGGVSGSTELLMIISIFVVLFVSAAAIVWAVVSELRFHVACVVAANQLPEEVSECANKNSLPRIAEWWNGPGVAYRGVFTTICRRLISYNIGGVEHTRIGQEKAEAAAKEYESARSRSDSSSKKIAKKITSRIDDEAVAKFYLDTASSTLIRAYFHPFMVHAFDDCETDKEAHEVARMLRAWCHFDLNADLQQKAKEEATKASRFFSALFCVQTYARKSVVRPDYKVSRADTRVATALLSDAVSPAMLNYLMHSYNEMYVGTPLYQYTKLSLSLSRSENPMSYTRKMERFASVLSEGDLQMAPKDFDMSDDEDDQVDDDIDEDNNSDNNDNSTSKGVDNTILGSTDQSEVGPRKLPSLLPVVPNEDDANISDDDE